MTHERVQPRTVEQVGDFPGNSQRIGDQTVDILVSHIIFQEKIVEVVPRIPHDSSSQRIVDHTVDISVYIPVPHIIPQEQIRGAQVS